LGPEKLLLPKTTTEDGIEIDFKPFQENEDFSIRSNREPLSNRTDSSDHQLEKLCLPKTTTEDGISIEVNPLLQKADSSIRSNREPLSNRTDSSDLHQ
jgi:hypothetical protein